MGLPVGLEGPDVAPVGLVRPPLVHPLGLHGRVGQDVGGEVVGIDARLPGDEVGDDVPPEIVARRLLGVVDERLLQDAALEDVVPHRDVAESGLVRYLGRNGRLLHELDDAPRRVGFDAAELSGLGDGDDVRRKGHVGLPLGVPPKHLLHIHLVDVVGREDADPVRPEQGDEMHVLEHGVGRALEPVLAAPHLRGHQRDEEVAPPQRAAELPASLDVLVEGLALELNEDVQGKDAAVDEV